MARKPLELQSLKWPFVGLAVLLALSSLWAVYDEVFARRPWKRYQREFFALETAHLKADLERAEKRLKVPAVAGQREAAVRELDEATRAISGNAEQRRAFDAAAKADEQARIKKEEAKLYLGFDKSESDAAYYLVREARHHGDREHEARQQKKLDGWDARIKEKDKVFREAIAHHEEAGKARLAFQARKDKAKAALDKFDKPLAELREKIATASSKWPAMEQFWIRKLENSWGGPTVDRCQNCHAGVDKAGFSAPWEVLQAKRNRMDPAQFNQQYSLDDEVVASYDAVHDKFCERMPEEPVAVPVGGFKMPPEPPPAELKNDSVCKDRKTHDRWMGLAEAYCGRTGRWLPKTKAVFIDQSRNVLRGEAAAGAPWVCFDKDVVASFEDGEKKNLFDVRPAFRTHPHRSDLIIKSHALEQFGCTTCHGGEGAQTKGVEHKAFRHGSDDHHWNDPLTEEVTVLGKKYKGAFLQSKCDKCHTQALDLPYAPLLSKGKKLFIDVGCWGCHPSEGYNDLPKRGPTLTNIQSKSPPGWLQTWIANPRGFRPHTRMPNFWPGAVDANAVPHPAGKTADETARIEKDVVAKERAVRDREVAAITAYLMTSSDRAKLVSYPGNGDAKKGKELFDSIGCRACHVTEKGDATRRSEASKDRDYAPNLFNIADKANADWIHTWVRNPRALWPQTKMPDLRLSETEAADITAYMLALKTGEEHPTPPEYAGGGKERLASLSATGKELIGKYGCFGCHDIKGFETSQKIATELSEHGRKDPHLLDYGDVKYFTVDPKHRETYANWIWIKLGTPRVYAYERVESKMPQFDFTEDEKLALLTFLKGLTGEKPIRDYQAATDPQRAAALAGERLVYWAGCRNCHVVENRGGALRDRFNEDDQSFAPPILNGQGWKTQPQWLFSFLKEPMGPAANFTNLRPWVKVRMPTFHFTDEEATGLVQYFSAAARKSYPYLTTTSEPPPPERMKEAQALFDELKCMSCHVLGEMRPGQDPGSAAPNLLLAKHRLRPDWLPAWMMNPNAITEGTRMPSFWDFSDPKKPTAPSKTFGGDGKAQIEALRDLIMHMKEEAAAPKRAEVPAKRRGRGG